MVSIVNTDTRLFHQANAWKGGTLVIPFCLLAKQREGWAALANGQFTLGSAKARRMRPGSMATSGFNLIVTRSPRGFGAVPSGFGARRQNLANVVDDPGEEKPDREVQIGTR